MLSNVSRKGPFSGCSSIERLTEENYSTQNLLLRRFKFHGWCVSSWPISWGCLNVGTRCFCHRQAIPVTIIEDRCETNQHLFSSNTNTVRLSVFIVVLRMPEGSINPAYTKRLLRYLFQSWKNLMNALATFLPHSNSGATKFVQSCFTSMNSYCTHLKPTYSA